MKYFDVHLVGDTNKSMEVAPHEVHFDKITVPPQQKYNTIGQSRTTKLKLHK